VELCCSQLTPFVELLYGSPPMQTLLPSLKCSQKCVTLVVTFCLLHTVAVWHHCSVEAKEVGDVLKS